MDNQVPIKRKSSRRQPDSLVPSAGGMSNIPVYAAIGAAGLALGVGYICMKKIQQQQADLSSMKEKEKQYETFQNQIKQLEENNQLLYSKLQKSEQTQNRLGNQFNAIHSQLVPQQTQRPAPTGPPRAPHTETVRTKPPPEHVSSVPKPTQVQYVEPPKTAQETPTRIVLSAEDKIRDPQVHL
jgi:hypothetical protein